MQEQMQMQKQMQTQMQMQGSGAASATSPRGQTVESRPQVGCIKIAMLRRIATGARMAGFLPIKTAKNLLKTANRQEKRAFGKVEGASLGKK
jgi:hypothetical protein